MQMERNFFISDLLETVSGPAFAGPPNSELAAEAAQLAENLPDDAAIEVTHLADLLISICLAKTVVIVTVL